MKTKNLYKKKFTFNFRNQNQSRIIYYLKIHQKLPSFNVTFSQDHLWFYQFGFNPIYFIKLAHFIPYHVCHSNIQKWIKRSSWCVAETMPFIILFSLRCLSRFSFITSKIYLSSLFIVVMHLDLEMKNLRENSVIN